MDRVISDEDIIVDKMIAASQKKGETALPSYGRNFVPYFVPGASDPGELDINVNTDIDNFRRAGASVLDAPQPIPLGQGSGGETRDIETFTAGIVQKKGAKNKNGSSIPVARKAGRSAMKDMIRTADSSEATPREGSAVTPEGLSPPRPVVSKTSLGSPSTPGTGEYLARSDPGGSGMALLERSRNRKAKAKPTHQKGAVTAAAAVVPLFGSPIIGTPPPSSTTGRSARAAKGRAGQEDARSPLEKNVEGKDALMVPATGASPVFVPFGERFAGPAYTNSPPPSSLPLPEFCRSATTSPRAGTQAQVGELKLNNFALLGASVSAPVSPGAIAKSAPTSPPPERVASPGADGILDHSSATQSLRRILNLELPGSAGKALNLDSPGTATRHATASLKKILQLN